MRTNWLDENAELALLEEKAQKLESFTQALADGVIEEHELAQQQERVIAAMKAAEGKLDDEQHGLVTELLVEITAFNVMKTLAEIQNVRAKSAFGD